MGSSSSTVVMSLFLLVLAVTVLVDSTLTHSIVGRIPVTHTVTHSPARSHFTPSNLASKRFVDFGSSSQRKLSLSPSSLPTHLATTKGFLPSSLTDTRLSPPLSSISPQTKPFPRRLHQTSSKPSSSLHPASSSVSGSILRSFTDLKGSRAVSSRLSKTHTSGLARLEGQKIKEDDGIVETPEALEELKSLVTVEDLVDAVKALEPEEALEVVKELETQVVNIDRNDFEIFSVMLHPEEELAGSL